MRICSLLACLALVGCATRPEVAPEDNFTVSDFSGVKITYPYGGGRKHIFNHSFQYEFARAKISVRKRRFYANGTYRRTLHKGDQLMISSNTVLLNGHQIFP